MKIINLLAIYIITLNQCFADSADNVIVLFGDSITSTRPHLPESAPPDAKNGGNVKGLPIGPTVVRLQELLDNAGKDAIVLNYGFSGTTSLQGLDRIDSVMQEVKASYPESSIFVGVLYGTNDLKVGGLNTLDTYNNIKGIVDCITKHSAIPVIATLLPRQDFDISSYNASVIDASNEADARISDHNSFWLQNLDLFEDDGLHPTLDGYILMGQFWFEDIFDELIPVKKK